MNYSIVEPQRWEISNAELMLLQIVSQVGEISGYEINRLVEERDYRVWADIGTTSIYTGLEKLRRKGLVSSHLDVGKRGRGPLPKKFRLTGKGRRTLQREIERALSSTRERDRRFDLALSAIPALPLEKVKKALRKRKQFLREVAKHVQERLDSLGGEELPINIKSLFKHSLHLIKHEMEFIENLLADLNRAQNGKGGFRMNASASQPQTREKLILRDFKPWGGKHCWSTALKNVLDYRGLNLSEEMLFGLGGGVGFIYWYMKFMPAPFIGTRYGKGTDPLVNTCERIGGAATIVETASPKKGYEELKSQLREGEPALVFVDMAFLPYLALPELAHFGAHTVVVFGVDEEKDRVYLADRARVAFTVRIEDLEKARNSKFPPFAPKNKLLKIAYPEHMANLEDGIRQSIRECCAGMLSPPIKNIGLAGMQKWAGLVPKWPRQFKGLALLGCLFNVFLYIEVSGTGGSAFRTMYAQFLDEASAILDEPALADLAEAFQGSARLWNEIARAALPDSWPTLRRIRELSLKKDKIFEERGPEAFEEMQEISLQLDEQMKCAGTELEEKSPADLLSALQEKILECQEVEKAALERLAAVVE